MTGPDPLLLVSEGEGVAQIVLNRPREGNSLSIELVAALAAQLDALAERREIKVIVLSGAGGRIFCAGHDLNEFAGQLDMTFLERDFAGIAALMQQVVAQPQIMIAKVEGVATAAGLELVCACDLAIAAQTARFAVPGVNIGFWCHTPQVLLSRTVGRKQAMEMLATGQLYPAEHALRIGLVNALYPADELDRAVAGLAGRIAEKAGSVLRAGKVSFNGQTGQPLAKAYALARAAALANIVEVDAQEGISAFLEKRDPRWQD